MQEKGLIFSQGIASSSRATIISLVPFPLDEFKPGLIPGQFHVDACLDGEPVCAVISDAIFFVYIDADRGNLRVPAPSYQVASAVCYDYVVAQMEAKEECHPAIFAEVGIWTPARVKKELGEKLDYFRSCQERWFVELIKRADDDWAKMQSHFAISDTQRYALKVLDPDNTHNRQWAIMGPSDLRPTEATELTTQICGACGSDIPLNVVLCKYCGHIIDEEKYKKMSFAAGIKRQTGVDLGKVM